MAKNVVFTGPAAVAGIRITRPLLMDAAKSHGWNVQGMVNAHTTVVVSSSPDFLNRQGRKLRTADRLGIDVISPSDFLTMLEKEAK